MSSRYDGSVELEQGWLKRMVAVVVGMMVVILIALLLVMSRGGTAPGPADVFESHLAALDAADWRLADTFVKDECTVGFTVGYDDPQEALQEALDSGFSFRRAFDVQEVWISEDGSEALLGVKTTPPDLPNVIELEKVDGEWLVAC